MDTIETTGALRRIVSRFRKPDPERLAWEQPLRAQLLRRLLILAFVAEVSFLALAAAEMIGQYSFPWIGLEALLLLVIGAWLQGRGNVAASATLLVISLSHVAAFVIAAFGIRSGAPALLLPTLLIAGLVIGGYFLGAWTAVCVVLLLWLAPATSGIAWPQILFWCVLYVTTAYLVWIFSFHLEKLLAASRRAGDEQRDAVLEERTRLAREVHDTLAQGFTGIVVQINAAEQAAGTKDPDVWGHLEKARTLARQSLEEARRSILTLRTSGPEEFDLLARIEQTARQLLADDSVEFKTLREGSTRELPGETRRELLRVGQEAVANAIRHSGATKIHVSLACLPHQVSLSVADNGRGIPPNVRGLGIQGMEERMRRSGGELKIERGAAAGTKVIATVPLNNGSAS